MAKEFIFNEQNEQDNRLDNDNNSAGIIRRLFSQRIREVSFICLFALSLFLLLSLLSYTKADPNWFGLASFQSTVLNSGGWLGAYFSDALFCFFGWVAYAVPVVMVYLAWFQLYPSRFDESENDMMNLGWQLTGAVLFFMGATGLLDLVLATSSDFFPYRVGGAIGEGLAKMLSAIIRPEGAFLLLLAFFLMGVTLVTGFSWMALIEKVGIFSLFIGTKLFHVIKNISVLLYQKIFVRKPVVTFDLLEDLEPPRPQKSAGPRIDTRADSFLNASVEETSVGINRNANIAAKNFDEAPESSRRFTSSAPAASTSVASRARAKLVTPSLQKESKVRGNADALPPLTLLEPAQKTLDRGYSSAQLESMAREVEQRLLDFGIEVQVVAVHPGPVITRFELQLAAGVKVSRIAGLAKDLARSLSVSSVRVVDVIPGKPVIGLELPNQQREMVRISEVFLTDQFQQARSPISLAMGVDISGYPVVVDLAKMPHLLVAGTTGSGKSVGLNAMLLSILYKATPEMVRLILVDPKMLEFSIYDGIPHLLTPVVTDMKEAAGALRWSVAEMERRYRLMSSLGVRNLAAYNSLIKEAEEKGEPIPDPLWKPTQDMQPTAPFLESLPYIVVVIDELADMMMVVGKKVEQLIARIAQKARAAGIHLILATQRPSVDVLTGLIKSNIPTRISFQVSSKIDSRTILDQQGAEQLLGHGDMLYLTPGSGAPMRIHGAFVDDKEVHRVTNAWRELAEPEYVDIIGKTGFDGGLDGDLFGESSGNTEDSDPLYDEAVQFVTESRKASISALQRRLKVGYNRAARLIEEMERTGIVSPMESGGMRDVLTPRADE